MKDKADHELVTDPSVMLEYNEFRPGVHGGMQLEKGENGTPHFQGWVIFKSNQSLAAVKKLHGTAHWEMMRGSRDASIKYCSKPGSLLPYVEWGSSAGQGHRSDLDAALEALGVRPKPLQGSAAALELQDVEEAPTDHALAEVRSLSDRERMKRACLEAPAAVVKFHKGLEKVIEMTREVPKLVLESMYQWQHDLVTTTDSDPIGEDRKIYWVWEADGNRGKSTLIKWLVHHRDGCVLTGRLSDMAHMWDASYKYALFDVARTQCETIDHLYTFAEHLKNGILVSSKYMSQMKTFTPPRVLFFANVPPPAGKWSSDRLVEWDLSKSYPLPKSLGVNEGKIVFRSVPEERDVPVGGNLLAAGGLADLPDLPDLGLLPLSPSLVPDLAGELELPIGGSGNVDKPWWDGLDLPFSGDDLDIFGLNFGLVPHAGSKHARNE